MLLLVAAPIRGVKQQQLYWGRSLTWADSQVMFPWWVTTSKIMFGNTARWSINKKWQSVQRQTRSTTEDNLCRHNSTKTVAGPVCNLVTFCSGCPALPTDKPCSNTRRGATSSSNSYEQRKWWQPVRFVSHKIIITWIEMELCANS